MSDKEIVNLLLKDRIFLESIESEFGKVKEIWADWTNNRLIYDLLSGSQKFSVLTDLIDSVKKSGYVQENYH